MLCIYSEIMSKNGHFWGDSVYWTTKLFRAIKKSVDCADIMIFGDRKIKWQGKLSVDERGIWEEKKIKETFTYIV